MPKGTLSLAVVQFRGFGRLCAAAKYSIWDVSRATLNFFVRGSLVWQVSKYFSLSYGFFSSGHWNFLLRKQKKKCFGKQAKTVSFTARNRVPRSGKPGNLRPLPPVRENEHFDQILEKSGWIFCLEMSGKMMLERCFRSSIRLFLPHWIWVQFWPNDCSFGVWK